MRDWQINKFLGIDPLTAAEIPGATLDWMLAIDGAHRQAQAERKPNG